MTTPEDQAPEDAADTGSDGVPLRTALEAILMVVDEPVGEVLLAQVTEKPTETVLATLRALAVEYDEQERGFQLREVAGGWRFYTRGSAAAYVERFVLDGQPTRLSPAALETLAVVAYRQPVSRPQVASIRGVNADAVMRTLAHRGYIEEVGRDPGPGQAVLYGTTSLFLEKLGLDTLAGLPPLSEFVPGPEVVDAFERSLGAAAQAGREQSGSDPVDL
jgi:segregation and condensation protein B